MASTHLHGQEHEVQPRLGQLGAHGEEAGAVQTLFVEAKADEVETH